MQADPSGWQNKHPRHCKWGRGGGRERGGGGGGGGERGGEGEREGESEREKWINVSKSEEYIYRKSGNMSTCAGERVWCWAHQNIISLLLE